ncbi:hypothetical protein LA345_13015 [Burkholderia vietnamiensis]|uniref:Uncharacterized protein n=1 Tax=Burkholderia vietnamiensis (strain G4 / LMG 22486) TaxID=269482 RepID=A4JFL9_BURVG|nr:hypothetical protein Bcep1808_2070 [Burkholderia vietnamiensis G4]MCB4344833.1 hypothetical protein [Burkholderia vietnamiensis]
MANTKSGANGRAGTGRKRKRASQVALVSAAWIEHRARLTNNAREQLDLLIESGRIELILAPSPYRLSVVMRPARHQRIRRGRRVEMDCFALLESPTEAEQLQIVSWRKEIIVPHGGRSVAEQAAAAAERMWRTADRGHACETLAPFLAAFASSPQISIPQHTAAAALAKDIERDQAAKRVLGTSLDKHDAWLEREQIRAHLNDATTSANGANAGCDGFNKATAPLSVRPATRAIRQPSRL